MTLLPHLLRLLPFLVGGHRQLALESLALRQQLAGRLIGSVRRECLNHVLVRGERHLRRIVTCYFAYYHRTRTHLALEEDAPDLRPIARPAAGNIVQFPEVGGLHHRYLRQAAQFSVLGPLHP